MEIAEAVNPASFTTEQKQYLEGFFAGAMQRFPQPFVGLDATGKLTATSASAAENLAEEKIVHVAVADSGRNPAITSADWAG